MPPFETVDLERVEILKADVPIHGRGSPPEGDVYTETDLAEIARDTNTLIDEVRPRNRIGHSEEQRLLRASGFIGEDEQPAGGWLANFVADGKSLYADIKAVPKMLAELIEAGAFRERSAGLRLAYRSQTTGETHKVVDHLGWLGAKAPAVKSLQDVVALYADQAPGEDVRIVAYAVGDPVWPAAQSFERLREAVSDALNPGPDTIDTRTRYWVRDIAPDKALVQQGYDDYDTSWVVPFSVDAQGVVTLAPASDWVMAQQAWVQASADARENADARRDGNAGEEERDKGGSMADLTLTEDKAKTLAAALGVDPTGLDADQLLAKVQELKTAQETAAAAAAERQNAETRERELAERVKTLEQEAHTHRRDAVINDALRAGKIAPADVKAYAEDYDASPELTTRILARLRSDEKLLRTYGSDDARFASEEERKNADDAENAAWRLVPDGSAS